MGKSYIKLLRALLEWEWYKDSKMVHLFIHLLLKANFKDGKFQGIDVRRGQLIVGVNSLSESTGISVQSIRTCLNKLKLTNEITIKSTNKFSLITIVKYEKYQDFEVKPTRKPTNKQQTTNKQLTTIEEGKKEKKVNTIPSVTEFLDYVKEKEGIKYPEIEKSATFKYDAWVTNDWKDGNDKKISNWKTKILNTLPHLPRKKIEVSNSRGTQGIL